jgi:hypothetical protein
LLVIHCSESLCRIASFGCTTSLDNLRDPHDARIRRISSLRQAYLCQLHRRVAFVASYSFYVSAILPEKLLRRR